MGSLEAHPAAWPCGGWLPPGRTPVGTFLRPLLTLCGLGMPPEGSSGQSFPQCHVRNLSEGRGYERWFPALKNARTREASGSPCKSAPNVVSRGNASPGAHIRQPAFTGLGSTATTGAPLSAQGG